MGFLRSFVFFVVLGLALEGCGRNDQPAQAPVSQTQTTGGFVNNPSYGNSDIDAWSTSAGGNSTHGTANPLSHADAGP